MVTVLGWSGPRNFSKMARARSKAARAAGKSSRFSEDPAQVVDANGDVGMVRAEDDLVDVQGVLEGGFGGGEVTYGQEDPAKVVDDAGYFRVFRSKLLFKDGQSPLEGGLCGGEVTQVVEDIAQVVDADGDVGMVRAEDGLVDVQGALGRRLWLHASRLIPVRRSPGC